MKITVNGIECKSFVLNGIELGIRRVSRTLIDAINKRYKAPPLPTQIIEGIAHEYRPDEYDLQVKELEENRIEAIFRLLVLRGVEVEFTPERLQEVKELREFMHSVDTELDPDDKYVYVGNIVIQDGKDYLALQDAILSKGQPTESQVQENLDNFRS